MGLVLTEYSLVQQVILLKKGEESAELLSTVFSSHWVHSSAQQKAQSKN